MSDTKPKIRFKGFTDPWEQRKLLQISDKVTEKNSSREYSETFTNSAEFGIISQREFFDKDISNEENIDGYYIVKNDDFVYNPRISTFAPVGPIKRNKLGRDGVMSPLYYVFRTHDIDPTYLEHFFTTTGWHKFMKLNGDSGARSDRFSIKDSVFKEMPLPYPSIDEQEKIGEFFDVITNLATLHQRKCEMLQKTKKALLEKMFPQNGSAFPEVRFKGFTDPWEQRKLIDKVDVIGTGKSKFLSKNRETEGNPYAILGSTSVIGYDKDYDYSGDFVLTARVGANAGDLYRYSGNVKISDNTVFLQGQDLDFIFFLLTRFNLKTLSFGTGQPLIKASELSNLELMFPKQVEENKQIAKFFNQVDNLITLHQRAYEALKQMKQALLQKMFV